MVDAPMKPCCLCMIECRSDTLQKITNKGYEKLIYQLEVLEMKIDEKRVSDLHGKSDLYAHSGCRVDLYNKLRDLL